MDKIIKTIILIAIYCFIWTALKKVMYGEVQPRTVDDIMILLLIPIFYKAACTF